MARGAESATKMSFTTKSYVFLVDPCTSPNFPTVNRPVPVVPVGKVVGAVKLVTVTPAGVKPGAIVSLTYATNEFGFRFVRTAPGPGGV